MMSIHSGPQKKKTVLEQLNGQAGQNIWHFQEFYDLCSDRINYSLQQVSLLSVRDVRCFQLRRPHVSWNGTQSATPEPFILALCFSKQWQTVKSLIRSQWTRMVPVPITLHVHHRLQQYTKANALSIVGMCPPTSKTRDKIVNSRHLQLPTTATAVSGQGFSQLLIPIFRVWLR